MDSVRSRPRVPRGTRTGRNCALNPPRPNQHSCFQRWSMQASPRLAQSEFSDCAASCAATSAACTPLSASRALTSSTSTSEGARVHPRASPDAHAPEGRGSVGGTRRTGGIALAFLSCRKAWCHLAFCFVAVSGGKTGDGRLSIISMSNELKIVPPVDTFKHVRSSESGHALHN